MQYKEIRIKIPSSYEDEIRKMVDDRIRGILSYEILKPTQGQQTELADELSRLKDPIVE